MRYINRTYDLIPKKNSHKLWEDMNNNGKIDLLESFKSNLNETISSIDKEINLIKTPKFKVGDKVMNGLIEGKIIFIYKDNYGCIVDWEDAGEETEAISSLVRAEVDENELYN
jgi:hypothetical protein